MRFGIFLVLLGGVFLLDNLGLLPSVNWSVVWPIILIAIGVSMILDKNQR